MMLDQKGFPAVSKMHTQPNGGKFPASIQPAHLNEESLSVCGAYIPAWSLTGLTLAHEDKDGQRTGTPETYAHEQAKRSASSSA